MIDVDKCKYRDSCSNFCLAERDAIGETRIICTGTGCYFKLLQRKKAEHKKYEKLLNNITNIIKNRVEEKYYKNCKHFKNCTNACGIGIQEELRTIFDIISKAKVNENAR